MKRLFTLIASTGLVAAMSLSLLASPVVGAADPCKDLDTSVIKCDTQGGNPIMSLVMQVTNFLSIGVGILVVGGIVWGSLLYTTSNGEPGKAQQGITVIVNAVLGLILFIFAYAIIDYLTPGSGII